MFMLSFCRYLKESFLLENKAWHQFVGQHGAELLNRANLTYQYSGLASERGHGTPQHVTDFLTQMLGLHDLTDDEGRWVLKHFQNGKIQRHEDIQSTVIPNLMRLRDARSSGKSDASLSKIKGPDELHGHLSRVDPLGDMSFDGLDPEEYTVHGDNKHWTVVQPHTKRAACTLGKGTNWCTSSDRHNRFDYYDETGPLHIFIPKKPRYAGERYQSHTQQGLLQQMMDDRDAPVYDNPRISGLRTTERPLPKEVEDMLGHVITHDILNNPNSTEEEILKRLEHPTFARSPDNVQSALHSKYENVSLAALDHLREHDSLSIRSALHSPFESVAMKAFKHQNFDGYESNLRHAIESPHESVALAAIKHPRFADGRRPYDHDVGTALKSRFKSVAVSALQHPAFEEDPYNVIHALKSPHEEVALAATKYPFFKQNASTVSYALSSPHESVALEGTKHKDFGENNLRYALESPHESVQTQAVNHPDFGYKGQFIRYALRSPHENVALAAINHPNFANLDTGMHAVDQAHITEALQSPHESVQLKAVEHPAFGSNFFHTQNILNFSKHLSVITKVINHPAFTNGDNAHSNFMNAFTHRNPQVGLIALSHPLVSEYPELQRYAKYTSPHAEVREAATAMYGF